eukprot:Skav235008  [mRNA]  locus=scaffold276:96421:104864:+ [translate_table: standard]
MDGEHVGDPRLPCSCQCCDCKRNERFLLHPRGSLSMRFEVIDHRGYLRGQCILGTQSLWGAADRTGGLSIKVQLVTGRKNVSCGELTIHCRMWDGLPAERVWWESTQSKGGKLEDDAESSEPDLFDMLDKDGDGILSKEELQAAIQRSKAPVESSPVMGQQSPVMSVPTVVLPVTQAAKGSEMWKDNGQRVHSNQGV